MYTVPGLSYTKCNYKYRHAEPSRIKTTPVPPTSPTPKPTRIAPIKSVIVRRNNRFCRKKCALPSRSPRAELITLRFSLFFFYDLTKTIYLKDRRYVF